MGTIGIIGAMDEEIALVKKSMEIILTKEIVGLEFYVGRFEGKNIVLVKSGIGKVNAAVCTQVMSDHFDVDNIINVGIAGGLGKNLKIGDVVVSSDTVQYDMDTSAFGDPVGIIPRMEESYFKASPQLVSVAESINQNPEFTGKIYVGRIASGDQFINSESKKEWIYSNFNAICVEMEGAAIAQTCYLNKIPFIIIRSISDTAIGEAHMTYAEFTDLAAKNSFLILKSIVSSM